MEDINVIVVFRKDRRFLSLRYQCPVTGEKIERSSGTANRKQAQKQAGEWQAELRAGKSARGSAKWAAFREAYEDNCSLRLRQQTLGKVASMFNVVEDIMRPDSLRRINPQWISLLQKRLLKGGRSAATVASICRHLKRALNWAQEQGMISAVPKFDRLNQARQAKQMKGRAVTGEEFDRMLLAISAVIPEVQSKAGQERVRQRRQSIQHLLHGLWLSGLRLGEALCLTWDQWSDGIRVDASGEFVKLLIPAEAEKGGRDRVYPVTPDFAEFLLAVPEEQRAGYVFNPVLTRGVCRRLDSVSKAIVAIGKAAGVKVDERKKNGKVIEVWASAHDLRRAFGTRWSRRVTAMVLKELMRHASVTTTETYYVDSDADATAAMLRSITQNLQPEVTVEVTPARNSPQAAGLRV
jgi:integrase